MKAPVMLVSYLKEKVHALETMDQIMSATIERLKFLLDPHSSHSRTPDSRDC